MAISATAKNTGVSVKKMVPIIDLVRGRMVNDSLNVLDFMQSPAAHQVAKIVRSASANAENELMSQQARLRIVEIYANAGPKTLRFRARARGRGTKIIRRNSHVTVVVDEGEE